MESESSTSLRTSTASSHTNAGHVERRKSNVLRRFERSRKFANDLMRGVVKSAKYVLEHYRACLQSDLCGCLFVPINIYTFLFPFPLTWYPTRVIHVLNNFMLTKIAFCIHKFSYWSYHDLTAACTPDPRCCQPPTVMPVQLKSINTSISLLFASIPPMHLSCEKISGWPSKV